MSGGDPGGREGRGGGQEQRHTQTPYYKESWELFTKVWAGFKETNHRWRSVLRLAVAGSLASPGPEGTRAEAVSYWHWGRVMFTAVGRGLPDRSCGS